MNLLDAHKIVHQYAYVFATGKNQQYFLIPASILPYYCENWKDITINASKLFLAYTILWSTRAQEQFQALNNLLLRLNDFVSDEEAMKANKAWFTIERSSRNKLYKLMHKKQIDEAGLMLQRKELYFHSGVDDVFNHMLMYKNNVFLPQYNERRDFDDLVYQYCIETYRVANIEFRQNYEAYFYSFEIMRKRLDNPSQNKLYARYKDYLITYQS